MSHWVAIRHVVSNAFRGQRALLKAQWRRTVSTVNVPDANAQTDSDEYLRLVFDDKYVWNQHCANSAHSPAVGLLGNPNFANVEGFEYAAKQAIQRSQIIVERIWRAPENGPEEMRRVVKNLDRLSDTLCSVIDMAEFIRNAHPGPEVMEAANKAYMDLCYYMNILNTDTRMHKVLSQVMADPSIVKDFTADEHAAAIVFLRDFEKSGIHLPDKQRKKFVELSDEIIQLGRQFTQCDFHDKSTIRLPVDQLRGVDHSIVRPYILLDKTAVIPANSYACQMILKCAESSETRKAAYEALNSANDESVRLLEALLHTRGELANLVGKNSFAELQLQDKMAKNPENVDAFLKTLLKHQAPVFNRDMQILQQAMGNDGPINVWDKEYLMRSVILSYNKLRETSNALPYFSIGSVMQGLSRLFKRLYGIQLVPATMHQGESWHPDVRKLDVVCEREGKIGTIYCDLFSRPGKTNNAAHYTVRTSRRVDNDDADNDIRYAFPNQSVSPDNFFPPLAQADTTIPGREGRYQLPVIALTCDFNTLPHHQATAMLSMSDVETLFHEMGHAMHSMLGQTDFHNVAGTRCATDFVELPSVLMEHFAWHPSVLKLLDAKLSTNAVQNYLNQRRRFSGIELNSQILMALLDQAYHSKEAMSPQFSSRQVWQDLQDNYGMFPGNPKTMWPVQFGHLFGYGAGYYSYLFDRTLARRIWEKCFENDPLDREQGQTFRDNLLSWGGARDPWASVAAVLGGKDGEAIVHGDAKAMRTVGDWGIDV